MQRYIRPSRNDQKWIELKEKLLNQYTKLTESDLSFDAGRKNEMIERVRNKLGVSEAEIKLIFQIR